MRKGVRFLDICKTASRNSPKHNSPAREGTQDSLSPSSTSNSSRKLQSLAGLRLARHKHAKAPSLSFPSQCSLPCRCSGVSLAQTRLTFSPFIKRSFSFRLTWSIERPCSARDSNMTEPSGLQTTRPFRPVICTHRQEREKAVIAEGRDLYGAASQLSTAFSDCKEGEETLFPSRSPVCRPLFLSPSATEIYS